MFAPPSSPIWTTAVGDSASELIISTASAWKSVRSAMPRRSSPRGRRCCSGYRTRGCSPQLRRLLGVQRDRGEQGFELNALVGALGDAVVGLAEPVEQPDGGGLLDVEVPDGAVDLVDDVAAGQPPVPEEVVERGARGGEVAVESFGDHLLDLLGAGGRRDGVDGLLVDYLAGRGGRLEGVDGAPHVAVGGVH